MVCAGLYNKNPNIQYRSPQSAKTKYSHTFIQTNLPSHVILTEHSGQRVTNKIQTGSSQKE